MPNLEQLRTDVMKLDPNDFDEFLVWIARVAVPPGVSQPRLSWVSGIEQDPQVCGGEPRIVRTRIPIWALEQMRRLGVSEADILRSYPTLNAEDLVHAWAYVDLHREEIEKQIAENEDA